MSVKIRHGTASGVGRRGVHDCAARVEDMPAARIEPAGHVPRRSEGATGGGEGEVLASFECSIGGLPHSVGHLARFAHKSAINVQTDEGNHSVRLRMFARHRMGQRGGCPLFFR